MTTSFRALLASTMVIASAGLATACFPAAEMQRIQAASAPQAGEPSLAEMRAATAKYLSVDAALAAGYIRDPANICETAAMMGLPSELGGMGIHYVRPDLLGVAAPPNPRVDGNGTHTDIRNPAVLIYEPQADGSLELVAVENLVFEKAWAAAGHSEPPSFHGNRWNTMRDDPITAIDEAHGFAPHHDRHVWLYRENPNGIFAPFNPRVSCAFHHVTGGAAQEGHTHVPEAAQAARYASPDEAPSLET